MLSDSLLVSLINPSVETKLIDTISEGKKKTLEEEAKSAKEERISKRIDKIQSWIDSANKATTPNTTHIAELQELLLSTMKQYSELD